MALYRTIIRTIDRARVVEGRQGAKLHRLVLGLRIVSLPLTISMPSTADPARACVICKVNATAQKILLQCSGCKTRYFCGKSILFSPSLSS